MVFRIAGVPFIYRQSIGFVWSWGNGTKHTGLRAIKKVETYMYSLIAWLQDLMKNMAFA